MRKYLYWSSLASVLTLTACTPQLVSFTVPSQVLPNSVFEIAVDGDSESSMQMSSGGSGCVLQIPNGFTVAGYRLENYQRVSIGATQWDDPLLLSSYAAEPGHYLTSFYGTYSTGAVAVRGRLALRVFLQAPAGGASQHHIKVALVGGSFGAYAAVEPAGVTQFSQITAAPHAYPLAVVPGAAAGDFELTAPNLPLGVLPLSGSYAALVANPVFGDMNDDGKADLVGGGSNSSLSVLISNPGQPWTNQSAGLVGQSLYGTYGEPSAVGDFDGDGARDFVLADGRTFFGNGGSSWTPGAVLLSGPACGVAAGDTNSDGRADVLLCAADGAMRLYQGNANRTFTQANNGLPTLGNGSAYGVLVADLTGDGNLDIYATRMATPNVWIGDGAGNWTVGSGVPANSRKAVAGDVTGDTSAELVLAGDSGAQGVEVYRHMGNGVFGAIAGTALPTSGGYNCVAVIDFDGDGAADIVLGGHSNFGVPTSTTGLQLWRNTGSGQFLQRSGAGLSTHGIVKRIVVADFDGDGASDIGAEMSGVLGLVLYRNARAHAITRIAHGCGVQAIHSTGSGVLGTSFVTTLSNTTGVPFLGLGFAVVPTPICGNCIRGHDWLLAVYGTTHVLNIPNNSAFSGLAVGIQGLDLQGTSGCAAPPAALTDTLVLTIR